MKTLKEDLNLAFGIFLGFALAVPLISEWPIEKCLSVGGMAAVFVFIIKRIIS